MSHVDEGTLTAYADGALDAIEKKRVDAHLSACSACRAVLEEAKRLSARSHEILAGAAPAFAPPPSFDELVARSKGNDEKKGLEGMSRLAWAASLALAIGLGWYARGIVRGTPQDLAVQPASPSVTAAGATPKESGRPASLTPVPSPRRGEGNGTRDHLAAQPTTALEPDVKAEGQPTEARRLALQRPADSTRTDALADAAKTADIAKSNAGAGSGTPAGSGGVITTGIAEGRAPAARAIQPLQLQATPSMPAREPAVRVFTVAGLDIIRRRAIVPGSDVMRTVQSIDSTHELELIQEPMSGERRRVPGDTAQHLPTDTRSVITIERDGYRIMGRAKVSADSLRVLLSKLQ